MPSEQQHGGEAHGARRTIWIAIMAGATGIAAGAGVVLALVFAVLWIIEWPAAEMRAAVAPKVMPAPAASSRLAEAPALRREEVRRPPSATTTGSGGYRRIDVPVPPPRAQTPAIGPEQAPSPR